MSKFHLKLLPIFLIVYLTLSCSPNYELKDIQTGIANFQITNDKNQSKFSYTYFSNFQAIPQLAFAINNIQSRNIIDYQDFYIIPLNKTNSQIDFSLTHKQGWSLITINFILTTRNDMVFESFAINLKEQVSKNFIVQIKPKFSFQKFTSKIFLNGFQMNQSIKKDNLTMMGMDISLRLVSFSEQNLQMDFTGDSFQKIRTIYLSYVMIQVGKMAYVSDQGSISIDHLKGVQSRNLQSSFIQSQYKLYGINRLRFEGNSIALISSIKSDLTSTIYSTTLISQLVIDYFVLSNHPRNICSCGDKELKYSFKDSCLDLCPMNTFAYNHPEGGYVCLLKPVQVVSPMMNKVLNYSQVNIFPQLIQNNQVLSIQQISSNTSNKNQSQSQSSSSLVNVSNPNYCESQIKNSYFDGKACSCIPGFKNVSNQCVSLINSTQQQSINTINNSTTVHTLNCTGLNEINTNGTCTCINGYQRNYNNQCVMMVKQNITCGTNSFLSGNQCICMLGYVKTSNNTCILKNASQITCQQNQINNGLDVCICQQGYFNVTGKCVKDKPCPLNSIKTQDGQCTCKQNFFNITGECSICPSGQYWLTTESKCVQFCGQNSIKNNITGKCQCIPTYGISKSNTCQYCPSDKFIINNYCVSCPLNQHYNQNSRKCQCNQQFHMEINGLCLQKCPNNQYFDTVDKVCKCLFNLGRLNGACQICPNNYYVKESTQECVPCSEGSIFVDGKCVCKNQFVPDMFGNCVPCGSVANTFMYKGKCSTCAGQKLYNGTACICPFGRVFKNLKCIKACKDDQLTDNMGNCYKCPVNEVVFNNQCVCRKNYQRVNDTCQLVCPQGSFIYKNKCSVCPGNKVYDAKINGCVCPDGLYLNVYNQCQRLSIKLIQCPLGQYLDMEKGCTNCISSCEKCDNPFTCLKCQSPYFLSNGKCKDVCGNGIVQNGQQCDDRNNKDGDGCSTTCKIEKSYKCSGAPSICLFITPQIKCGNGAIQKNEQCDDNNSINNDGCSSLCKIQRMFSCYGQPSTCKYNATFNICGNGFVQYSQQCDDGNFINNDGCNMSCAVQAGFVCINQPSVCTRNITTGMVQYGKINYNLNNVFISLQTDQKYQFNSNAEMENFIKVSFINVTYKPSTYCTQRQYPQFDIFDCLFLYSSGIPNRAFKVQFSYLSPVNSKLVQLQIDVDPLTVQIERIKNLRRL